MRDGLRKRAATIKGVDKSVKCKCDSDLNSELIKARGNVDVIGNLKTLERRPGPDPGLLVESFIYLHVEG